MQAKSAIATDFIHVENLLLTRAYVLMFIEHRTCRIHLAGITTHPRPTGPFDAVFQGCGLRILRSPPQAPRSNTICERLIGSIRREALGHTLILNQSYLRTV